MNFDVIIEGSEFVDVINFFYGKYNFKMGLMGLEWVKIEER